jgi:hypothetical protein
VGSVAFDAEELVCLGRLGWRVVDAVERRVFMFGWWWSCWIYLWVGWFDRLWLVVGVGVLFLLVLFAIILLFLYWCLKFSLFVLHFLLLLLFIRLDRHDTYLIHILFLLRFFLPFLTGLLRIVRILVDFLDYRLIADPRHKWLTNLHFLYLADFLLTGLFFLCGFLFVGVFASVFEILPSVVAVEEFFICGYSDALFWRFAGC